MGCILVSIGLELGGGDRGDGGMDYSAARGTAAAGLIVQAPEWAGRLEGTTGILCDLLRRAMTVAWI
jgi:hypothetical protein